MHHAYLELERYDDKNDPYFDHYEDVDPVQILQKSYEASLLAAEKEVTKTASIVWVRTKKTRSFLTGAALIVFRESLAHVLLVWRSSGTTSCVLLTLEIVASQ